MAAAKFMHVLGIVVWVGGMFFAYMALRPVAAQLEPPHRLKLWLGVLQRFFFWVWIAVAMIIGSGLYMMQQLGGMNSPLYVYAMMLTGIIMVLIFAYVYFAPFRRLQRATAMQEWKTAGAALNSIRILVAVNLALGLINVAVGAIGKISSG